MYKTFFGLQKSPFNLTPDPAFLFLPPKHREALAGLTYAVMERKGFVVLTGDAGTGKTTLLNSMLNRLPPDRIESSVILNPTLTGSEFLEGILLDFDIPDVPVSKAQRLWKLQDFLARTHQQNRVAVLVIDEAHKLSLDVLEEIRLLGNFEGGSQKYLQIVLLGQPELDELLNRRDLRQLRQRIALRMCIEPLNATEVCQYIRFRWIKAGGRESPPFTAEALEAIIAWSEGIPRLVNSICDTALLAASGDESPVVGVNYVRDVAANLGPDWSSNAVRPPAVTPPVSAPPPPVVISSAERPLPVRRSAHFAGTAYLATEEAGLATLAAYSTNSSLLKRLADRFGIRH